MGQFEELIKKRRSTRKFTSQPLSPEQVQLILSAALMAPSSKMKNPWQFIVVEDKEMLKRLSESKEQGAFFIRDCAMAVVVAVNVMESDVWIEDAAVASIYMQLQAEDLGLGSCWCQIRNRSMTDEADSARYVRQLLDIPYQLEVLSIIGFGYKDQVRKPFNEDNLQWEKVHIGKFRMDAEGDQES
jgi:nitroreductase